MRGDTTPREERVRERAQQLWENAGKPLGRDEEFWHEAERQIRKEQDQRPDPMFPPRGSR
jgi:hypothetical protein